MIKMEILQPISEVIRDVDAEIAQKSQDKPIEVKRQLTLEAANNFRKQALKTAAEGSAWSTAIGAGMAWALAPATGGFSLFAAGVFGGGPEIFTITRSVRLYKASRRYRRQARGMQ